MEKTYKRVPFNIELAKKIQSGDIEGKIVTVNGKPVRILAFDINDSHPIVAAVTLTNNEVVYTCKLTGKHIENSSHPAFDLAIELLEETPKNDLKVENKPRLVCPKCLKPFDKCKSQPAYHNKLDYVCPHCGYTDDSTEFETYYSQHPYNKKKKYNFKPFDKVLVRMCDEEVWKISLYGFKRGDSTYSCINTSCWEQCIPYEGNEHLLGTTNNPYNIL